MSLDVYLLQKCECGKGKDKDFWANITHNLNEMADKAGLYEPVWQPERNGFTKAGQLIEPLEKGIALLKEKPDYFRTLEPENKWGTYDDFIDWLEKYLQACQELPDATISVSR